MTEATTAFQHNLAPPTANASASVTKIRGVARGATRGATGHGHGHSKNKTWVAGRGSSAGSSPAPEGRWDRGRGRGRGTRGRGRDGRSGVASATVTEDEGESDMGGHPEQIADAPNTSSFAFSLGTPRSYTPMMSITPPATNGITKTWDELVKAREAERARAIREGKMDDPLKPKRLEDAITIVGTCMDMCPEFERYRRERENNLDKWECIIGPDGKPTRKVDHARAVKIYERGQGDKIIPSDLRPAPILKLTLDYLFHDLLPRGGFPDTQAFVRDRSRAVRNDFTIQQDTGPVAMESHERCTRFHILSLHLMTGVASFDRALEIQQTMNSLLSLKEFYDDQRGKYESLYELEMRIYHRLGLIRDQHERNDKPPPHIAADPAFILITRFRTQVQAASSPITKVSQMKVDATAMQTFGELANVLRSRGNVVMIYLVACFLEHIFGKDTIDDIESIRGPLTIQNIIDGVSVPQPAQEAYVEEVDDDLGMDADMEEAASLTADGDFGDFLGDTDEQSDFFEASPTPDAQQNEEPAASPFKSGATQWSNSSFDSQPKQSKGIFSTPLSTFGAPANKQGNDTGTSVFGKLVASPSMPSGFGGVPTSSFGSTSSNVFGGPVFGTVPASSAFPVAQFGEPSKSAAETSSIPNSSTFPPSSLAPLNVRPKTERRSLADAAPLPEATGEQDKLTDKDALTFTPPPPFAVSQSAPVLDASAPPFVPKSVPRPPSITFTPPPPEPKATLPPIQTDSLRQTVLDPIRRGVDSPSPSLSSPSPSKFGIPSNLSINTGVSLTSTSQSPRALAFDSPIAPPPLGRKAPISLPGTPTGSSPNFFSNTGLMEPLSPLIRFDYPSPRIPLTPSSTTIATGFPASNAYLSPSTPDRFPKSPLAAPPASSSPTPSPTTDSGVLNTTPTPRPSRTIDSIEIKSRAQQNIEALHFARSHSTVRSVFAKWKERYAERCVYKEAVRRSDEYKQRLSESASNGLNARASSSSNGAAIPRSSSSFKRQREISEAGTSREPARVRRRMKSRISHPEDVRTDEELVARLAQNKKKNEMRWARGTFTSAIREDLKERCAGLGRKYLQQLQQRVGDKNDLLPPNWTIWLCMNQSNDQTAIWLEQKFDVPNSGNWESEVVFSIPVSSNPSLEGFPGLIVFECTPLEGISDEIDRKYHILDDLARLRDVLSLLPDRRHFVPSLLVVNWDSESASEIASDVKDMIAKNVKENVLGDTCTLPIHFSEDLDQEFKSYLAKLDVDLSGRLVEWLSLKELFDRFANKWSDVASVWIDASTEDDILDWVMFSHVLEEFVDCLNTMLKAILSSWSPSSSGVAPLPKPAFGSSRDTESASNTIRSWLRSSVFDATYLASSLNFSDLNEDFEAQTFLDHILDLVFLYIQRAFPSSKQRRAVTKKNIESSSETLTKALDETQNRLRKIVKDLPRISPRRSVDERSATAESLQSSSRATSPLVSISAFTNGTKKQRLSMPSAPSDPFAATSPETSFDAPPSPTPSAAPSIAESSTSTSHITVAMLRELSRSVLSTYGSSKSSSLSKRG